MRFRNRFTGKPSELSICPGCGLRISATVADGRETVIHEHPLCEAFKLTVAHLAEQAGSAIEYHRAMVTVNKSGAPEPETVIFGDGDTLDDAAEGRTESPS